MSDESNNHEGKRIVEDAPSFCSMQIKPLPSSMLMVPKATPMAKRAPIAQPLPQKAHNTTTTTSSTKHINQSWNVATLSPVPPIYVLERTHIFVQDSADNVAKRVAECLRTNSMAAQYYENEVAVDVETQDNVQFTVRLWEAGKSKPGHVLIETQKTHGCGYSYVQAAKSVLRAAKGMAAPAASAPTSRMTPAPQAVALPAPPPVPMPSRMVRPIPQDEKDEEATGEVSVREGLSIAAEMLSQKQHHSSLLALETLEQLSRTNNVHQNFVARHLLSGQDGFCNTVVTLIQSDPRDCIQAEKDFMALMRRYALAVLANCVTSLEQSGEFMSVVAQDKQELLTSRSMLMALTSELAAAHERPHEACYAAECLRALLMVAANNKMNSTTAACSIESLAQELGVLESLSQAQQVGAYHHVGLEGACTKFRAILS
ncbi:hypothetical protein ACA910_017906 [Epithemia clementina (nom. ined.)]